LERHLDALEARETTFPEHRQMTVEERIEVALILLAYVYEGDTGHFANYLIAEGAAPEEATKHAALVNDLLEERRGIAPDPRRPV
jgi:hypothetical protein